MSHATPGDLCTDECVHICAACQQGVTPCEDIFTLATGSDVACMSDEVST